VKRATTTAKKAAARGLMPPPPPRSSLPTPRVLRMGETPAGSEAGDDDDDADANADGVAENAALQRDALNRLTRALREKVSDANAKLIRAEHLGAGRALATSSSGGKTQTQTKTKTQTRGEDASVARLRARLKKIESDADALLNLAAMETTRAEETPREGRDDDRDERDLPPSSELVRRLETQETRLSEWHADLYASLEGLYASATTTSTATPWRSRRGSEARRSAPGASSAEETPRSSGAWK
jgi:hypothetical protein